VATGGETKHTIEPAASGRAKCRGCGRSIAKDALRFGERLPNPFAEGRDMTHWFHLRCAAMKRPEVLLETINDERYGEHADTDPRLRPLAESGIAHRRLPRVDGAERSPTGRARCRHCREMIGQDTWRIGLVFYEEGQFNPAGYLHAACANAYFETAAADAQEIVDRIAHFAPTLTDKELGELEEAVRAGEPNVPGSDASEGEAGVDDE